MLQFNEVRLTVFYPVNLNLFSMLFVFIKNYRKFIINLLLIAFICEYTEANAVEV